VRTDISLAAAGSKLGGEHDTRTRIPRVPLSPGSRYLARAERRVRCWVMSDLLPTRRPGSCLGR
jgi:hypothetical protein